MELRWLGAWVFVASTACDDAGSDDGAGPAVQLTQEQRSLFDLMHWEGTAVPPTPAQASALSGVDAAADAPAVEAAVLALAGDVLASQRFDPLQGRLDVDTIERDIVPGPDLTDEQALRDGVTSVVLAMGAPEDQLSLELSGTTVTGGSMGEDPSTYTVDKKVHVHRTVLGFEVGDGGTATFEMAGPLISMSCAWHRFDYDASTLFVDGIDSEEAVMAALAEHLVADGFELTPTLVSLEVGTYYRAMDPLDPTSDTWTLRLVGYAAAIDSRGGTIPSHEFYLDDGTSLAD